MEVSFGLCIPTLFIQTRMSCQWSKFEQNGHHRTQYHLPLFESFELILKKDAFMLFH